jgi:hypothetical protein
VGTEPIPASLRQAGPFALNHDAWAGLLPGGGYTAPAGAPRFPLPKATVLQDRLDGATRHLEIAFSGSPDANGMLVAIPKEAKLVSLDLRGQHMAAKDSSGNVRVICWTPDCRDLHLSLVLGNTGAVSIAFAEVRYGLPDFGARLQAARPETAMASQSGDEVVLANKLDLAAK